jgi:hypothetical protein
MQMLVEAAIDLAGKVWVTLPRAGSQIEQPSPNVSLGVKNAAAWKNDRTNLLHAPLKVRDLPVETDLPGKLLGPISTLLGILTVCNSAEPSIPGRAANCQNKP